MLTATTTMLNGGLARHVSVKIDGAAIPFADALSLLREDERFRSFFLDTLNDVPFAAYKWETPPVTRGTAGRAFEYVQLDAPALLGSEDPKSFAGQFGAARDGQTVVAFPNLGNDAVLVVPCPVGPPSAYGHLAAFAREAPLAQRHELLRTVGVEMNARLGIDPVWLSTAGMGVAWLHVRLDSRPKYYGHRPFAGRPT